MVEIPHFQQRQREMRMAQDQMILRGKSTLKSLVLPTITLLLLMSIPAWAMAMLPWFAQDWSGELFDNGVANYPETVQLIEDHAWVYAENFANSGNASRFVSTTEVSHYLGLGNLWYGGLPGWADPDNKAMTTEENFFHGHDPSSLVGWRTNPGGIPTNTLRWDWDMRFVSLNNLYFKIYDDKVIKYKVLRREVGQPTWNEIASVTDQDWFEDTTMPNSSADYEYLIKSVFGLPEAEYSFTPEQFPVLVSHLESGDIKFWVIREGFQEERYKSFLAPISGSGDSLERSEVFNWRVTFGVTSMPETSGLTLEVKRKATTIQGFSPIEVTSNSVSFEFSTSVAAMMDTTGGMIYRLHYEAPDESQNTYFPQTDQGYPRWLWATVNNRVMQLNWASWAMNIQGEAWRNTLQDIVQNLCVPDGVDPGEGLVVYDGIFFDTVNDHLGFNIATPYEYGGSAAYLGAMEDFLTYFHTTFPEVNFVANGHSLTLADRLKSAGGVVGGFMYENWCVTDTWVSHFLPACWLIHNGSPDWQIWIQHGIDLNYHTQYTWNGILYDDYANLLRQQALVAFLMAKDENTLFGYGNWKVNASDLNPEPNFPDQVAVVPEQLLNIGLPLDDPYSEAGWPEPNAFPTTDAAVIDFIHSDPHLILLFSEDEDFLKRAHELDLGMEGTLGEVWAVIDVNGTGSARSVSLDDILGPDKSQNIYYRLELENTLALVTEGATLWTRAVSSDEIWESSNGQAAIFFSHPIRSPLVSPTANVAIGSNVLEIQASQWNGLPLQSFRVKNPGGSLGGWPAEFLMSHVEGDTYSYTGATPLSAGSYAVDVVATGTDGLMYFGTVDVVVADVNPIISPSAGYKLIANNPDQSSSVAVEVTSAVGESLEVSLSDPAFGFQEIPMVDDGVYPDVAAGDHVYSSPLLSLNLPAGAYDGCVVTARAFDGLGQLVGTTTQGIEVQVIDVGMKLVESSSDTGDLVAMVDSTYSSLYFESDISNDHYGIMAVSKDNFGGQPNVYGYTDQNFTNGTPHFFDKLPYWFDPGIVPPVGGRGMTSADYDQDGLPDLFICAYAGSPDESKLFRNTGSGFEDVTDFAFGDPAAYACILGAHTASWCDYNMDGFLDLFVASNSYTGNMEGFEAAAQGLTSRFSLFKGTYNDGTVRFKLVSTSGGATDYFDVAAPVLSATWNDLDQNGWPDLVLAMFLNSSNNPRVFLNQGTVGDTNDCTFVLAPNPGTWQAKLKSIEWIDANHDVFPDLLAVESGGNGRAAILLNEFSGGSGYFSVELLGTQSEGNWLGSLVGDMNLDGKEDRILLPRVGMPSMEVSQYDGAGQGYHFEEMAFGIGARPAIGETPPITSGGVCADFNWDHDLDLYLGRGNTVPSVVQPFFFRNVNPAYVGSSPLDQDDLGHHWVQINLQSNGNSNRSAIGAKVTVKGGPYFQTRVVDGGSGKGSQKSNQLIFGWGDFTGPFTADITWPTGVMYVDVPLTIDQVNIISEPKTTSGGVDFQIISGSETFSHQLVPGGADWIFEWDTNLKGDLTQDAVEWWYTGTPGPTCDSANPGTYGWGHPDVEIEVYPNATGWHHKLKLKNQICSVLPCPFAYQVHSALDEMPVEGAEKTFGRFKTCLGQ